MLIIFTWFLHSFHANLQFLFTFLTTWYVIFNIWISIVITVIMNSCTLNRSFYSGNELGLCPTNECLTIQYIWLPTVIHIWRILPEEEINSFRNVVCVCVYSIITNKRKPNSVLLIFQWSILLWIRLCICLISQGPREPYCSQINQSRTLTLQAFNRKSFVKSRKKRTPLCATFHLSHRNLKNLGHWNYVPRFITIPSCFVA